MFLSVVLVRSLSHTDVPWQPCMTEGEQRKRWRRWRKQKWDTDRSWDTETGAEGDVRTWEIVHISILQLLALKSLSHGKLKWQTRLIQKNKSVCRKMRERCKELEKETMRQFLRHLHAHHLAFFVKQASNASTSSQQLITTPQRKPYLNLQLSRIRPDDEYSQYMLMI